MTFKATTLKLPHVTPNQLAGLQYDTVARQNLLDQIITGFEKGYGCSLLELERKLENMEIEEHPAWEDSIEWRNAVEQLQRTQLSEGIFRWLQNLLMIFRHLKSYVGK